MDTIIEFFLRPFVGWMLLAFLIGQVAKTYVWTTQKATSPGKLRWFWLTMRRTMALHPVVLGGLVGWFWPGEIEEGYTGKTMSGILYFAIAGGLSVWGYRLIKDFVKERFNVDLPEELPGISSRPSANNPEELEASEDEKTPVETPR